MKKISTVIFILVTIFSVNLIMATPVLTFETSSHQPQETIVGTISSSGTLLEEITKSNLKFFEGDKQFFPDVELYRLEDVYYFYFTINKEGDFRIETDEILFNLAGESGSKKINKAFSVYYTSRNNETNEVSNVLSIKPGIIYTLSNTSQIRLFNRGSNSLSISIQDSSFNLGAYQAKIINVNLKETLSYINIGSYKTFSIPVIFLGTIQNNTQTNESNITEIIESELHFRPSDIHINLTYGETRIREIEFSNIGLNRVKNLTVLSNATNIKVSYPAEIEEKTSRNISFIISANETSFNETITLGYIENNQSFNLTIPVTVEAIEPEEVESTGLSCLEYGGTLCSEKCDGESNFTTDGFCCYGTCSPFEDIEPIEEEGGSSLGWLIGLLIFFILGVVGYVLYKRHQKVQSKKPEEKLEESKKRYENRLKGAVSRN